MGEIRSAPRRSVGPCLAALLLSACTVGPRFVAPQPVARAQFWPKPGDAAAGQASRAANDPVDPGWWRLLGDAELSALEQRLAASNLDLQVYAERLGQSRAQLGVVRADELPSVSTSGSYTRERPSAKGVLSLFGGGAGAARAGSFASQGSFADGLSGTTGGIPTGTTGGAIQPFNLWQYGFDASWELDLWGHGRREVEAARANLDAAREDGRNTLVSAEAELARDYIDLRSVQGRIALTRADLQLFETSLHLTRERARAGLATALDATNATAQLATAQADLPPLLVQQAQTLNAVCLLLGAEPGALDGELAVAGTEPAPIPGVPQRFGIGAPSELARRRPDIRAAEAQLHAATAQIGVAVADFYPKITLSGSIGIQALLAKDLGNWGARQYGGGPSISLPIFEGGRLRATLELRRAQQREAALLYRRTVLAALGEVSNALVGFDQEQARRVELEAAVRANRQSVRLATQRYRQGIATYLEVLDAQRAQLQTELALNNSIATVSTNMVAVFKALGGGWETPPDGLAGPTKVARAD